MIDKFNKPVGMNDDELAEAGFVLLLLIAIAVSCIISLGLWSQALAFAIGYWIGKRRHH